MNSHDFSAFRLKLPAGMAITTCGDIFHQAGKCTSVSPSHNRNLNELNHLSICALWQTSCTTSTIQPEITFEVPNEKRYSHSGWCATDFHVCTQNYVPCVA